MKKDATYLLNEIKMFFFSGCYLPSKGIKIYVFNIFCGSFLILFENDLNMTCRHFNLVEKIFRRNGEYKKMNDGGKDAAPKNIDVKRLIKF
jgi:hypothetical protein